MTLKQAVDQIGTWTVTGVTTNYGLDDAIGAIPTAALPALLLLPGAQERNSVQPFNLSFSAQKVTVRMEHLLITQGIALGRPQARFYDSIALVDNYIAEVNSDPTLGGYLLEPLKITSTAWGAHPVAEYLFYGVLFSHEWVLKL